MFVRLDRKSLPPKNNLAYYKNPLFTEKKFYNIGPRLFVFINILQPGLKSVDKSLLGVPERCSVRLSFDLTKKGWKDLQVTNATAYLSNLIFLSEASTL